MYHFLVDYDVFLTGVNSGDNINSLIDKVEQKYLSKKDQI